MAMRQAVASANLQMAIVIGGSAATELTCVSANGVSIGANDEIIFCIEKTVTTELMVDRTAHTTISAVGKIACSDDTTSDNLVVFWVAKDATVAIASPHLTVGVVPAGQYFMMGDNRAHSQDSVFWGFVPEDHIIGKAQFIGFSKDINGIKWDRLFKQLK